MLADVRAATTVQVLNDADCAIGGFAGGARLGSVQSASVTRDECKDLTPIKRVRFEIAREGDTSYYKSS
jgi:hypothetical protein